MNAPPRETRSRREFVRSLGRGAALGALAGLTAYLAAGPGTSGQDTGCPNEGTCRGCTRFKDCALPPARRARRTARSRTT